MLGVVLARPPPAVTDSFCLQKQSLPAPICTGKNELVKGGHLWWSGPVGNELNQVAIGSMNRSRPATPRVAMNTWLLLMAVAAGMFASTQSSAVTRYVDLNCSTPSPPYTNWTTAATNIQDAVDAAQAGDLILVTNGFYQAGGRSVNAYALTNRVAVSQALTVESVNGPGMTIIKGYQVPGAGCGDAAIRCAYLTSGAVLSGFTLTNGATRTNGDSGFEQSGGGVCCEPGGSAVVTNCALLGNSAQFGGGACGGTLCNCVLTGNLATDSGGGAYHSTLTNCTVSQNSAVGVWIHNTLLSDGGGASLSTVNNCTLTGNSAVFGGGAANCTLANCTLAGNSAADGWPQSFGGGAVGGTLSNCVLADNWADDFSGGAGAANATLYDCVLTNNSGYYGGGAYDCTLFNCTLTGNTAEEEGGGAAGGTLNNCILTANTSYAGGGAGSSALNNCVLTYNSASYGGGTSYGSTLNNCILTSNCASWYGGASETSTLNNCTLIGNSATDSGGGAYWGTLNNCVAYYNTASTNANYYAPKCTLNYCCTFPMPSSGVGNITNAPLLVDAATDNLRLQSNSPCINAGYNAYVTGSTDLDDKPRIKGATVDIGAYEFQTPASVISYAWLQIYGLPVNGSADYIDSDGDGMNNWQEWIAGTNPTNAASALRLQRLAVTPPGVLLRWSSDTNHTFFVQRAHQPQAAVILPTAPEQYSRLGGHDVVY